MKVLFLGSSNFSNIVLAQLLKNGVNVVGVITQPDKPSGRGQKLKSNTTKIFAQEHSIPVYTFDKLRNHIEEIKRIEYDLACVASFGQILPQSFLDIKPTINVHPSLLPKYRGATPIQSALLNGDNYTGVTIMKVALLVDSGDIIMQKKYKINDEDYNELEEKLALLGGNMASEVIGEFQNGSIKAVPQDNSKATLVKKLEKSDGKLDFSKNKDEIINKVRALSSTVGCFIMVEGKVIKIGKVSDASEKFNDVEERQIQNYKKAFIIGCNDGAIEVLLCQSPSGKMISGKDFINGHNEILGKMVE